MPSQVHLSEQLQLLDQLNYSDVGQPYEDASRRSTKGARHPPVDADPRVLDTISVALTTGDAGDVVAAAFDIRRQPPWLVLAKNGPASPADDLAVHKLLKVITASTTKSARDVLPFLFDRCWKNIKKRVQKMSHSLALTSSMLNKLLEDYEPKLGVEQFPYSVQYRAQRYRDDSPEFPTMMRNLFADITESAEAFNSRNADPPTMQRLFLGLLRIVPILQYSPLLRWACERPSPVTSSQAEQLKRRLYKLSQYYYSINTLIKYAEEHFPRGLNHRWVRPHSISSESRIRLGDCTAAISRARGRPLSDPIIAVLRERFPNMLERWRNGSTLTTRVHAELRIVLELGNLPNSRGDHPQQPVGCSKRSCLCCNLWINAYNSKHGTHWLTSGSHGKPYATWALPTPSYKHSGDEEVIGETVVSRIERRLNDALDKRHANLKRDSDEHRSSGSEPETEGIWSE